MADSTGPTKGLGGQRALVVAAALFVLTFLAGLALLFDWWPLLRGGFGWQWDHVAPTGSTLRRCIPSLVAIALFLGGTKALRRAPSWAFVAWSVAGAIAIPVALLGIEGPPLQVLFARTVSPFATGGYALSLKFASLGETLRQWPAAMPTWGIAYPHLAISPPGWPILYDLVSQALTLMPALAARLAMPIRALACDNFAFLALSNARLGSAWLGMASPLWTALTIVPLFLLARSVSGESVARTVAVWWPTVPALALFAGTFSVVYPLGTTAMLALFWSGLCRPALARMALRIALAGLLMGILLLFNFAYLPLLMVCGLLALFAWRLHRSRGQGSRWLLLLGLSFTAGIVIPLAVFSRVAGYSILPVFLEGATQQTGWKGVYFPWLVLNMWDLALFSGLPLCGLALVGVLRLPGRPPVLRANASRLAVALGVTLLVLELSGATRGEAGRIWIYFMPLMLVVAATLLASWPRRAGWLLLAQAAWLVVVSLCLRTVVTGVPLPPRYADVAPPGLSSQVVGTDATFGDELRLTGYQTAYQPATQSMRLALHWQPRRDIATPYYFSAVLVAPDGTVLPAKVWQPFATRYPTTCWRSGMSAGQPTVDQIELPLGTQPLHGNWWLSLSVFAISQNQPLPPLTVRLPDGATDQQIGLGPLPVAEP